MGIDSTPTEAERPRRAMYKLTSNQLYFQVKQKSHKTKRKAFKPDNEYLKNEILSLEPAGFTRRQLDVVGQGELPLEFVSNMNQTLKITLLVNVEAIGGTKRIMIRSTFIVNNNLPLPLRLAAYGDDKSEFYVSDADQSQSLVTLPIRCFNPDKMLSVELGDLGFQKCRIGYAHVTPDAPQEQTFVF